ncbi:hypothetical protein EZV62_007099 [Acer yangbiense]|uniref:Rieske domain-containing protein n=1 Tax=Acer yangbiense TaxID=1000413 RepID=A0A5C7I9G4_9ROSI|nr:hypothetical protein EZV62_007099 [Acer yangbiense]
MPLCDLDKRVPHGKKVLGLDIVVWWDKDESAWKVFDDACPHRLAPLSDGRIDKSGRLQCAYHGWCFNGSGDCKLIPQAAPGGSQVHTSKKACARVYPSIVQHDMVWFWPNSDPEYKDIITKKKPPFIPQMDDPSFSKVWINRDIPYGYEVLVENLLDPSHIPYAHYGIMEIDEPPKVKVDREGGKPLDMVVEQLDINGFSGKSCNSAYKSLNALEVILQFISIVSIGIAAATKQSAMSSTARTTMVSMAVICFAASRCIEVSQMEDDIFLCQKKYAGDVLKKFKMEGCKSILTPVEERLKLVKDVSSELVYATIFQRLVGSLRYLTSTRLDIAYGVGLIIRFMDSPRQSHLQVGKRILLYVKSILDDGIFYSSANKIELVGYTDSDWEDDMEERKSTSGYAFHLGFRVFSWSSKKQQVVALLIDYGS